MAKQSFGKWKTSEKVVLGFLVVFIFLLVLYVAGNVVMDGLSTVGDGATPVP